MYLIKGLILYCVVNFMQKLMKGLGKNPYVLTVGFKL
jgi:hypothetical protein